jgi:hypothetical protein
MNELSIFPTERIKLQVLTEFHRVVFFASMKPCGKTKKLPNLRQNLHFK